MWSRCSLCFTAYNSTSSSTQCEELANLLFFLPLCTVHRSHEKANTLAHNMEVIIILRMYTYRYIGPFNIFNVPTKRISPPMCTYKLASCVISSVWWIELYRRRRALILDRRAIIITIISNKQTNASVSINGRMNRTKSKMICLSIVRNGYSSLVATRRTHYILIVHNWRQLKPDHNTFSL